MPFLSTFPHLDIPKCNILSHLFPATREPSDVPIWINSRNPQKYLTPRQLLQWVKRLAVGLDTLGVARGQPVMIFTPNHIFVPVAYLGIVGSGRIFSGANPSYTVSELAYQIRNTEASVLLAHPDILSTAVVAAHEAGLPKERVFLFSDESSSETEEILNWRSILGTDEEASQYRWHHMTGADAVNTVATINYSSGTTGLPKGVCVSHHNLVANVEQAAYIAYAYKGSEATRAGLERWVGFLPLYHAFGQLYACLMATRLETPIYIMKSFFFEEFLHVIQTYRITQLQVAPPVMVLLAKRPETARFDLSSLTDIGSGAAPLSGELLSEVTERLNVSITQGWGMTELTCTGIMSPPGLVDNPGSVGLLIPNCQCKLLDDDGYEVNAGEPGELFFRGPNVCLGYWRNQEATRAAIGLDGWLRTGDVAVAKDNIFYIVDRKKDLIKVKGFQVAPAELEAALLKHNYIADAAVVGIFLDGEERPRAYVTLKECAKDKISVDELQAWLNDRVAKYKQLVGGISFVNQIPKSPSGKILRRVLRDWAKRDVPEFENQIRAKL